MNESLLLYSGVMLFGTFIAAVSQVLLKKEAMKKHGSVVAEYLNVSVVLAYTLFVISTLMTVIAYTVIPLSLGPVLAATSYVYVTIFGVAIFKEKISAKKVFALALIILGIAIYSIFS